MTWNDVLGHDANIERFRRSIELRRLASTFLFVGPEGIGKRTFSHKLAQAMLCDVNDEAALDPCGTCPTCQQVASGSHPDLLTISRPADKSVVPVELLIGDREHRMREGLCHDISLKPYSGKRRIAVIDDADSLNQESANCLLKTLEEPPPKSVLILIGTSEQKQLPTIRSRSQIVRFQELTQSQVEQLLLRHELVDSAEEATRAAKLADGSVQQALHYADPDVWEFREQWLRSLADFRKTPANYAKQLSDFVDLAGKESPPRRARMKQVFDMSAGFYRELMLALCSAESAADEMLLTTAQSASQSWNTGHEAAASCLDRCLDAIGQVESNANQATLLECWVDDLQQITRKGYVPQG